MKIKFSPLFLLVVFSFILIDGSFCSEYVVIFSVLHEIAHIFTLKIFGEKIYEVRFRAFGIQIKRYESVNISYFKETIISLSGPFINLLIFIIFLIFYKLSGLSFDGICIMSVNFILFLINIIPIYPLDGGKAVYYILLSNIDYNGAKKYSRIISFVILIPLIFLSVVIFFVSGFNISLILITAYLLILSINKIINKSP